MPLLSEEQYKTMDNHFNYSLSDKEYAFVKNRLITCMSPSPFYITLGEHGMPGSKAQYVIARMALELGLNARMVGLAGEDTHPIMVFWIGDLLGCYQNQPRPAEQSHVLFCPPGSFGGPHKEC
jgi:hypothetical protein